MLTLKRMWYSLNFRYAMSERYLASQRDEYYLAAEWGAIATEWKNKWRAVV